MLNRNLFLIIFIALELTIYVFFRNRLGIFIAPLFNFLISIFIGIFALRSSLFNNNNNQVVIIKNNLSPSWIIDAILYIVTSSALIIYCHHLFQSLPIDMNDISKSGSDVIPQIMHFVERWKNGTFPYTPIIFESADYTLQPTYLPFQWMPYIVCDFWGIDYRFTGIGVFLLAYAWYLFTIRKYPTKIAILNYAFKLLPIIFLILYSIKNKIDLLVTVELLVASYYFLLGLAIVNRKWFLIALFTGICLLSRYSIIIGIPFLLLYAYFNFGTKKILFALGILLLIFGISYLPFLIQDPTLFEKGLSYYYQAAIGEWTISDWQKEKDIPFHLQSGYGIANLFYTYANGDLLTRILLLKNVHLAFSIITTLVLIIYFWKHKYLLKNELAVLASLKIYLAVFYYFIVIPYGYIYLLPIMLNFAIIAALLKMSNKNLIQKMD